MLDSNQFLKFVVKRIDALGTTRETWATAARDFLDQRLCAGNAVAVVVNSAFNPHHQHVVVVYGKEGTDYLIADPAGHAPPRWASGTTYSMDQEVGGSDGNIYKSLVNNNLGNNPVTDNGVHWQNTGPQNVLDPYHTHLSEYKWFQTIGYVQDPDGDASALNFSLDNHAELLVSDPKGLRTGISGAGGMILEEIPDTAYLTMTLGNEETGDPSTAQTGHTVDIPTPVTGIYQVRIAGVESAQYTLGIRAFSQDGSAQPALTMPGVTALGSVSLFNIQFASEPGAISQVRRVASFQSTLADIDNSSRIGLIDNRGIANSLSQKVAAASDAVVRGERGAAANVLNAFRNEVLAQSGKTSGASALAGQRHLFGVAPQVLLEDAQSLISQIR